MDTTTMPTAGKTVINTGIDPALLSMLGSGKTDPGMMSNPLLWLITLGFLTKNGGIFGGGNATDAAAASAVTTSKDIAAQLNTMTAAANAANNEITEGLCHLGRSADQNTASIIPGQSAQNMNAAQNTAATIQAITTSQATLAAQLAKCCCDNQLAVEQTKNLVNMNALATQNLVNTTACQTQNQLSASVCEIKQHEDDNAQKILAAINQQNIDDLRQRLAEAQNTVASLTNTGATSQIVGGAVDRLSALINSCPCGTK